ncbi:MAG TPA: hypothetical protein PKH79_10195, partial [Prolixibacteraceae bacterium]|nr:hypothetical protein [Prolixibacteraceae bacterium]
METKEKKSINYYMRSLHRDLGFLAIGLTIIYALSGIILIYRDTDFLKKERNIEQHLSPNLTESDLGMALHMRNFQVLSADGETISFSNGTYNKVTGLATYSQKALPQFLEQFNKLHKTSSRNIVHWFPVIYGVLLLFLAISSFWMYKPKSKMFRRGLIFAGSGIVLAIVVLFLI